MNYNHTWSGWPGAICTKCFASDANEECLIEHDVLITCVEGHMLCDEHAPAKCEVHVNGPCPENAGEP